MSRKQSAVVAEGLTDAQAEMVMGNLGLIGWTISRFGRQVADPHYSNEDAWQDGFFGLCRAAQKYDPDKGRFSTMAVIWIRQAIQRGGGAFAGRSLRSAYYHGDGLPDLTVSLDQEWRATPADDAGDVTLAGIIPSGDDPEGEAIAAALLADIRSHRDTLAATDRDRAIFDSLTLPVEGVSRSQQDEDVAARFGVTREWVRRTRFRMAAQLADLVGLVAA